MTNKDIQQLINKYLAGETSPEEEQQLAIELQQRHDQPEEWQVVKLMLGELTLGEAEYDAIMAERSQKPSAVIIALRTVSSIAAIFLIGLFLWIQKEPAKPVLVTAQEQPIHDVVTSCTGETALEQYLCYMEHKREQQKTYSLIRQMLYGNQQ